MMTTMSAATRMSTTAITSRRRKKKPGTKKELDGTHRTALAGEAEKAAAGTS